MASFVISRSPLDDAYGLWSFDADATELLTPVPLDPGVHMDRHQHLAPLGGYVLAWGPPQTGSDGTGIPYRLMAWDSTSKDPLNVPPLQQGVWSVEKKFFGYRAKYSFKTDQAGLIQLLPFTSFVMSVIPAAGRGTYELWNFDPCPGTPLEADPIEHKYTSQEAFQTIQDGHELVPLANYCLDRDLATGTLRLWSFDPQNPSPLSFPEVRAGLPEFPASQRLVVVGEQVLAWSPEDLSYTLWQFDPGQATPLGVLPVRNGTLPAGFSSATTLTGFEPRIPVSAAASAAPGSLDFMRERIKHVVFYMLESRSFDNVLGWLYEKGQEGIHFVGSNEPFAGASTDDFNDADGKRFNVSKYEGGVLSDRFDLNVPTQDPFHGYADALVQMFNKVEPGYPGRATPNMGGFVENNVSGEVMQTFSREQMPVLNGLAGSFAVSDAWFSSMPGGTDVNRAFSIGGSGLDELYTFEGGAAYDSWPTLPHRQSIWKLLWSYGITDWRIYWSVQWMKAVFTYQLFLKGQIPTVDANVADYVQPIDQFKKDAAAGTLPAFSYLEPVWIAPNGTTSYHPGADIVPGEKALNDIYQALAQGPKWEETLFVVTFSKNGGVYDHVPPQYARKPWPNDCVSGFEYDLLGPRVPAILVSPWVEEKTVFRSGGETPFDSTSFAATLLHWLGIPRGQWRLGDRMDAAPTFESAIRCETPRKVAPTFEPPWDKSNPKS